MATEQIEALPFFPETLHYVPQAWPFENYGSPPDMGISRHLLIKSLSSDKIHWNTTHQVALP